MHAAPPVRRTRLEPETRSAPQARLVLLPSLPTPSLDRPTGLPALNASGSEGRLSQQAQLELQRAQQPARAQWQRLQQLIHEKPAAAAAALVEQDPGPPAARNSSAVVEGRADAKS